MVPVMAGERGGQAEDTEHPCIITDRIWTAPAGTAGDPEECTVRVSAGETVIVMVTAAGLG